MVLPYKDSLEYILDELRLLDLRIGLQIIKLKESRNNLNDSTRSNIYEFFGLYISDEEAMSALREEISDNETNRLTNTNDSVVFSLPLLKRIKEKRKEIDDRKTESISKGVDLSLDRFSKALSFSAFEINILLVCLAPEIHSKYEKLYAYIQDDATKKRPTMGLILDLLCENVVEKIDMRRYFFNTSPLFRSGVLQYEDQGANSTSYNTLSKPLRLNEHVTDLILGHSGLDPILRPLTTLLGFKDEEKKDFHPYYNVYLDTRQEITRHLQKFIDVKSDEESNKSKVASSSSKLVFYLRGPKGSGRKMLVEDITSELKLTILRIDLAELINLPSASVEDILGRFSLEIDLQHFIPYLDNFDCIYGTEERSVNLRDILIRKLLRNQQSIIFLAGEKSWEHEFENILHFPVITEFPMISYHTRQVVWAKLLDEHQINIADNLIGYLSTRFLFSPKQIHTAIIIAKKMIDASGQRDPNTTIEECLNKACHYQSNENLSKLAQKVKTKYTWEDLVLPADKKAQLRDILNYATYQSKVYFEWGFEKKLSLGQGLNVMFSGEPGTGKTMASEVIANELNLVLFKIDLSSLVSKYIGETAKTLNKIFQEAETSNAILFFDEADAIFGKRTEIKDSHDRYANIEINYLLQKLEEHKGIVILATNYAKNIDQAFARRIHVWIEFSRPDEADRLKIWMNMFPDNAPIDRKNIEFDFLAKQFDVSGGIIKNAILAAAFHAAAEGGVPISMRHIIMGLKKEFDKIGRPCMKSEFGRYYDRVVADVTIN